MSHKKQQFSVLAHYLLRWQRKNLFVTRLIFNYLYLISHSRPANNSQRWRGRGMEGLEIIFAQILKECFYFYFYFVSYSLIIFNLFNNWNVFFLLLAAAADADGILLNWNRNNLMEGILFCCCCSRHWREIHKFWWN